MLSSKYRLRLEFICKRIADREEVQLDDMIWADKLAKANRSAGEMLRKARRVANNPDMQEGSLDHFLNQMDLTALSKLLSGSETTSQLIGANAINRNQ